MVQGAVDCRAVERRDVSQAEAGRIPTTTARARVVAPRQGNTGGRDKRRQETQSTGKERCAVIRTRKRDTYILLARDRTKAQPRHQTKPPPGRGSAVLILMGGREGGQATASFCWVASLGPGCAAFVGTHWAVGTAALHPAGWEFGKPAAGGGRQWCQGRGFCTKTR